MTAQQLIALLVPLPPDRPVLVDVTDLGFIDIVGLDDPGDEYPGVALLLDDKGPMQDAVRRVNAGGAAE